MTDKNQMDKACADAGKGAPDARKKCPLPQVSPLITISAPRIVLVKKAYQKDAHRIRLKLGTDTQFTGTGSLTSPQAAGIRVFDNMTGGAALPLPLALHGPELSRGRILYLEGVNPSTAMNDTTLALTITGGDKAVIKSPATDTLTRVELQLDLCQYKPKPGGADPAALSDLDKISVGRNLHLQNATNLYAGRCLVMVKKAKPATYTGDVILVANDSRVRVFDYAQEVPRAGEGASKASSLRTANGVIPPAGLKLWVEGAQTSNKVRDTGFTLEISDLPRREGDRVKITVVETRIDACQSRTTAGVMPHLIDAGKKLGPGRFVHVQDSGNHHGRARVLVERVKPKDWSGKMEVASWDAAAKSEAGPRLRLYDEEIPGGGAHANPYPFAFPTGFPATDDKELWGEGIKVSGALHDTELRLRVSDAEGFMDRAAFTVVKFSNLKVDIPSTPANIPRNRMDGGPSNTPTPRHDFTAGGNNDTRHYSDDFSVNDPLPLVEGSVDSADKIKLSVEIKPAGLRIPVRWSVLRAFDDNAKVKNLAGNSEDPGLAPDGADPLKAVMTANAAGSFRVRAYIDCNGNSKFDERAADGKRIDREPFIVLNMVLFRVQCVSNVSAANPAATDLSGGGTLQPSGLIVDGAGTPLMLKTGDFQGTGNDAVDMKAIISATGGGPDGKRGLDCLFSGWVNNELNCRTAPNPNHWGEDVTHHHQDPGPPVGPLKGLRCYWDLDGVRISGPILDAGARYGARRGIGGDSCIGTMFGGEPAVNKIDDPSGVGQRWTVANSDSPGGGIQVTHPIDPSALLVRFAFNLNFQCALLVWTNTSKTPGPAAAATDTDNGCCRLYSFVQKNTWLVQFESRFGAAYAETSVTAKTVQFKKDPNPTRRATAVKGSGFETRAPGGVTQGKYDKPFNPAAPGTP